tara:strand:- start:547 stop:708 length:162 start_codon:yes stop_codon:yes gene_type:complete
VVTSGNENTAVGRLMYIPPYGLGVVEGNNRGGMADDRKTQESVEDNLYDFFHG